MYSLGPGVGAGDGTSLNVDITTTFFVIGDSLNGQSVPLSKLESTYPTATVGIWIGLDVLAGITGTGFVAIPPVSFPPKLQIVTT